METWDAYQADGRKAGRTIVRGEPIPEGLYHIVADVLVRHTDGDYLVMRRDLQKQPFPGKYEAGASGSILAGETPFDGALRELKEETGITAERLTFLFALSNLKDTLYYCYLCVTDWDKQNITLQEGETIDFRWLPETEFPALVLSPEFADGQRTRWAAYRETLRAAGL